MNVRAAWKLALVAVLSVCAMGLSSCARAPAVRVTTVASGLGLPWDVTFAPDGRMFFTERAGRIRVRQPNGTVRRLAADLSDIWAVGEVGLMGIHVDPAFNQNRRIYTCQGHQSGGSHDIRIVPWVLTSDGRRLVRRPAIVTGIPATTGSHGGCRLRFGRDALALDRYRRRDDRRQPAGPQEPRGQDSAGEPVHRGGPRGQPVLVEPERQHAADLQLRPPQRAGHRAASRRHDVDRRARHRKRRRDQPGDPRQLGLGPGAGLQRGPAHDRPGQVPDRSGRRGRRARRRSPRPGPPGSPAGGGGPGRTTSRWPR